MGLRYRFGAGWKFVRIEPKDAAARKIDGGPRAGAPCVPAGHVVNARSATLRYIRSNKTKCRFAENIRGRRGRTALRRGEPVSWKGWRYITFPLGRGG